MMSKPAARPSRPIQLTIAFPDEDFGEARHGTGETQTGAALSGADGAVASGKSQALSSAAGRKALGKRKWYSLYDKVFALPNLQSAWARVRANRGAAGMDGITVKMFGQDAAVRLTQLHHDLRQKTYRPKPVRRVSIPKDGGGVRPLGIPTLRDRIVQQALLQVLGPLFEGKFSNRSHGFRPGRGCATALQIVDRAVKHGYEWMVDADLQAFFDTVDHGRLIAAINEEIADGSVLDLITRILQAGVIEPATAEVEPTLLGTPQGGPLSPLLANIYLHAFDQRMVQAGYGLVRYADDFVIFARSEDEARAALQLAREVLEGELGLHLHPEKTRVASVGAGFEFLGFHYFRDTQTGQWRKAVRTKSVRRFRATIRRHTPRLKNQRRSKASNMTPPRLALNQRLWQMVGRLNRYLRGWHWYYKGVWSQYDTPFRNFDGFVRQRVRTALTGRVGSGWWNVRLSNTVLRGLGLIPLDEWHRHYLLGTLPAPVRKNIPGGEPYAGNPHVRFGKAGGG